MFTIKIEFVHKMHYFKEQCETEDRWLQNHAKEENM